MGSRYMLSRNPLGDRAGVNQSERRETLMRSRIHYLVTAAAMMAAIGLCLPSAHAEDKGTVRAGYLTCHVASGWGFIFGSSRDLKCDYSRDKNYTGRISKFGADIGYLSSGVILWAVVAPTHLD